MTTASLEETISAVAARCLRTSDSTIDPSVPFALLGLDSLTAIELAAALEERLGRELPPELLADCPDVRSLARLLTERDLFDARDASDPFDRMLADSVLPADVQPRDQIGSPQTPDLRQSRAVLLTGATGFLGAWLARDLLQRSPATLYCIVRGDGRVSARQRLRHHLLAHGIDASIFDLRVRTIDGDLARPHFGCSDETLAALARDVDAICHAGASVNWIFPYAALRDVNVGGTLDLLRLACRGRPIPFHFVSSLSAAYSTEGPRDVDENFDALPHLRGVHLGYAQTKVVAEALVRQAGQRGVPVRIYRPSLLAGDSQTGAFNREDLLSALLSGCIRMGTAPDLDWQLDCLPVDTAARAIVDASGGTGHVVVSLRHAHPRHWRECVLWMRLYGYPLRLVSYHVWLKQLEREAVTGHPLRPLRSFFVDRPDGGGGLTLPELYEETRRTRLVSTKRLDDCPPLDAGLLDRYFAAFINSGHVPPPPSPMLRAPARAADDNATFDREFFQTALAHQDAGTIVIDVQRLGAGSDHSIMSELAAWRSKRPTGLFRFALTLDVNGRRSVEPVVVKIKAQDADVIAVGQAVAHVCGERIGEAYGRWRDRLGVTASHLREPAIYAQTDPRFVAHVPRPIGFISDDAKGLHGVVLETISDATLIDSAGADWSSEDIQRAVLGLASLHAVWWEREAELRQTPWIGYVASAPQVEEMRDLWTALADYASPAFSSWADPAIAILQRRLIAECGRWWTWMEAGPRTLIHHDFNPRNVCLRGRGGNRRLCAYDWELATIGAPQRDLAEFLTFVLSARVSRTDIQHWVDLHRVALEREIGAAIDPSLWLGGFRAGLYDLMLNRLPMYALIHRVRRQPFLPRLARTWRAIYEHFPL